MLKCIFMEQGGNSSNSISLQSIEITTPPTKTEYLAEETFDPTGMVVMANYGFKSNILAQSPITHYSVEPQILTDGITEVTVTYSEKGKIYTCKQPITVIHKLKELNITKNPDKMSYIIGDNFDITGMIVTATYSDGITADVTEYSYNPTNFTIGGQQDVIISYTENEVTLNTSIGVFVDQIQIPIPTWKNNLTFNENLQTVTDPSYWNNYDPTQIEISGTTSATNAGTYGAIFRIIDNKYKWDDNSINEKNVSWTINKAAGHFTLSTQYVDLDETNYNTGVQVTVTDTTGIITTSFNDPSILITVNDNIITIKGNGSTDGSFDIWFDCAESTNYTAVHNGDYITVQARYFVFPIKSIFYPPVGGDWWGKLSKALTNSTQEQRQQCIGEQILISNTAFNYSYHLVRCIGADQDGEKTLTFQTIYSAPEFISFGNLGIWIGSDARAKCQEYYNKFDGKEYIKTVKKGTAIVDIQDDYNEYRYNPVEYNDETVFLLSEREFGLDKYAPISTAYSTTTKAECTYGYDEPYSYYTSNDKRIFYKGDEWDGNTGEYGCPWTRSRSYNEGGAMTVACIITENGTSTEQDAYITQGFAPAFVIGPPPPPALSEVWGDENAIGDETWWENLQASTLAATPEERTACVGKTKKVVLTSPVLGTQTHLVRCIGADQDGDKTLTFQTTTCMKENTVFGSNAQWIGSTARAKCQEYYNAFPGKSYVKTVRKGTCPSQNDSRNASVTYNDETVFLLSEREFGLNKWSPISIGYSTTTKAECTYGYNAPYSYYNSKERRIFYMDDGSGSASSYYGTPWMRSRYYSSSTSGLSNGSDLVCIVSSGTEGSGLYYRGFSFAPAFVIG